MAEKIFPIKADRFISIEKNEKTITVFATKESLEKYEDELQKSIFEHRFIQNIVAICALKEAILSILLIRKAARSIFASSDDNLVIERIEWAIDQCNQARELQVPKGLTEIAYLTNAPPNTFQNLMNEIFEQFVSVLNATKEFISGKTKSLYASSAVEFFSQKVGWVGWKQIGIKALNPLITARFLISEGKQFKDSSVKENLKYINECDKVAQAFERIIRSLIKAEYPTFETISKLFPNDPYINKDNIKDFEIDADKNDQKKNSGFLSWFSGIGYKN